MHVNYWAIESINEKNKLRDLHYRIVTEFASVSMGLMLEYNLKGFVTDKCQLIPILLSWIGATF